MKKVVNHCRIKRWKGKKFPSWLKGVKRPAVSLGLERASAGRKETDYEQNFSHERGRLARDKAGEPWPGAEGELRLEGGGRNDFCT